MKLYFNSAMKELKNKNNFLVWFFPWNGIVRNYDGEEIGEISSKIMQKLIDSNRFKHTCNGKGLLDHERYYILNPSIVKKPKLLYEAEKTNISC